MGAAGAMTGLLHVALCCCRARIEVFVDQTFQNIGAPFEEPLADSFQEGQNFVVAQRLVGKFNGVGSNSDRVREGGKDDSWVDVAGLDWEVWGRT